MESDAEDEEELPELMGGCRLGVPLISNQFPFMCLLMNETLVDEEDRERVCRQEICNKIMILY